MEGELICNRGDHVNGKKMVILQKWSVYWRENSHLTEVESLMDGEWFCYRGGLFLGGRLVMFREVVSLMEGEWFMLRRWPV